MVTRTVALPRWGSGTWRTLSSRTTVLALVSLLYSVALIFSGMILLTAPRLTLSLGSGTADSTQIVWVLPSSTLWQHGVRPGQQVLALDDTPITHAVTGAWAGTSVAVQGDDGRVLHVEASMIRAGDTAWPLLLLSPWFLLLGTLVYLRAPCRTISATTYACFASAAFALALAPASMSDQTAGVVAEWIAIVMFAACFVLFSLSFPNVRRSARLRCVLWVPVLLASGLSLLTLSWVALHEMVALLRVAILFSYLLLGVGILISSVFQASDQHTTRGLTIVGIGTLASVLPFVGLYLGPALMKRPPILPADLAILPLALLPVSFAYAILRHNVLKIALVQRWLVRGLLWSLLLLVGTGMVHSWHQRFAGLPSLAHSLAITLILMLLFGAFFGWLNSHVHQLIDRLIFKDSYDYRAALRALSSELSSTSDRETLGMLLPATLCRLMNLKFALLLIRDSETPSDWGTVGSYEPSMLQALSLAAEGVQSSPQVASIAGNLVLLTPLRAHDAVVGHLCLGPKANGEPFRTEDQDLLATLSGQVAAVVQTVQLIAALRAQVQALDMLNERLQYAHEEERARLAADIHDEPLQTALHLQRQLATCPTQSPVVAASIHLSQMVVDQLRTVCTAIRPAALDDLGLVAALDGLAQEQSQRTGVPIQLLIDPEIADQQLPSAIELVLYRAAQEAITNCVRHARASLIDIRVWQQAQTVQLLVTDDGLGFHVPARFDALVATGHLGLAGIHERVQRVGGRLDVTSTPGAGTVVRVEVLLEGGLR